MAHMVRCHSEAILSILDITNTLKHNFFFESCCKFTNTNGQSCMQQAAKVREASKGETDKKQKQPQTQYQQNVLLKF